MHRSVLLRWAMGGFLGGVTAASFVFVPAPTLWACLGIGALGLLPRRPWATVAGLCLLFAVVGAWRTDAVLARPSPLWNMTADAPTVTVEGFVDGDFELTARGGKWPLRVLRVRIGEEVVPVDDRLVVYAQDWVKPMTGQALALTGKLQRPKNTGDFDYISYLNKSGIHAQMYFPAYGVPTEPLDAPWSIRARRPLFALRDTVDRSLTASVPGSEGAYLSGILLGTRGGVDSALKDAFSRTGTSHVLAISGYNITIVAAALMALLSRFGRNRSYWLTVAGVAAFTLMVGASASVTRAAIMGILALTAVRLGRTANAGNAILVSAAVMAAYNPMLVRWDIGFQLSFLAVVGIVYLEPLIRAPLERLIPTPVAAMCATTLAAQMMVLPLILHDFGTLAVYTLPVNLLVLPLVPVAMAIGLATGVIGLAVPLAGHLVGQVAWLVGAVQLGIIRTASALPYASLEVSIGAPLMLAAYTGIATWLFFRYRVAPEPTQR